MDLGFAISSRKARRRTVLLPAVGAAIGFAILALLWVLSPPAASSSAAALAPSIGHEGALPPQAPQAPQAANPVSTITWQTATIFYQTPSFDDIAPAVHPTDPLRALVGGPIPVRYTTDGGTTWQSATGLDGLSGGVPVWMPGGNGQSALQVSLHNASLQATPIPGPFGDGLNFARSTDSGASWATATPITIPGVSESLPYLWADSNPASPYYGRLYTTLTMLDAARSGSFDTVGVLRSTDQGTTWSSPVGLVDPREFSHGTNYNAFASAAIQPSGAVVVAWHRGTCCGQITNVPNKVMWSRSTDGGITFPISGTIATVPISQSLQYGTMAPGTFRWTPAPNIAADPVDGTLYAAWVAYRQPNTPTSAAVYMSRSTDNGASWSAPVIAGNGSYQYWYLPWVQVSPDHVVHLTFQGAILTDLVSHFYTQSTDRGATWSTSFQLTGAGYSYFGQGDYQATSLGGYNGSQGTILTSWQIMMVSGVRLGTFPLGGGGTPTPTPTCTAVGTPGPWTNRANYPQSRAYMAVASDGNNLFSFGGHDFGGPYNQAYKYTYSTNSWTPIAQAGPFAFVPAEYGDNGKIYVIAGGVDFSNSTRIYDIASDSWSSGAPVPTGAYVGRYAGAYWNGRVYVIGGYGATTGVYAYDIVTNTWSTLAPLPQGLEDMTAQAINGKIYVANGYTGSGPVNNLYIYDIATNTWSAGPPSPLASDYPGSAVIGGKLYMVGGLTTSGYTGNTYIYDPTGNSWSQGPTLNVARSGANAATINTVGGQTAIVVGGTGDNFWLNGVEASTAPNVPCGTSTATPTRTPTATATCAAVGAPGPWTAGANYPLGLTDIAVASDGTTVYGFGGRNPNGMHTLAYKYVGNTWVPIASMPVAIAEAGSEYGHNGKVYVIVPGGFNYIYDIATNSWSSGAPDPQGVYGIRGHAYWNGKVYVIGGLVNGQPATAVSAYDIATDTWSTLAPLPQGEYAMASTAINGKIYVANGQTNGGAINNLYIYDIPMDTWSEGASSPLASSAPGGTAIGGKLHMIGGLVNGYTSNTYLYDPATNTWSQGPSLNVARGGGNAATIGTPGGETAIVVGGLGTNGWLNSVEASTLPSVPCGTMTGTPLPGTPTPTATCPAPSIPGLWATRANYPQMLCCLAVASDGTSVYSFGGFSYSGWNNQDYKYNYAADSWAPTANITYSTGLSGAVYGQNGKIYVLGGLNPPYPNQIYDIASDSWSFGAPMPTPQSSSALAYWNGKIYVIGGAGTSGATNTVNAYDIAANTWSPLAPLPQAEYGMAAAAINGKIYVANGSPGTGVMNNLYIYDIATNTWSAGPPSPLASEFPAGTAINGKLYMIGGDPQGGGGHTANTYLYDPAGNSWSQGPSLNVSRTRGSAATINTAGGHTAVVVGGYGAGTSYLNSVEASTAPSVPCITATGTPPGTPSSTRTATATATVACEQYNYSVSAGTMISGTYDIGNHCDDCATTITLPFAINLYGATFTTAQAGSNGFLSFGDAFTHFDVLCLPRAGMTYALAPFWVDQMTNGSGPGCAPCGIYTATVGTAPNRTFVVEYRTVYFNQTNPSPTLDYEIQMQEGQSTFRYVYGLVTSYPNADSALTIGVQKSRSPDVYTSYYCDSTGHSAPPLSGQQLTWTYASCATLTATVTTSTATATGPPSTVTRTSTRAATSAPTGTARATAFVTETSTTIAASTSTPTPTLCPIQFSDVPQGSTFYTYIRCLACRGIVSGYDDHTFRPNNNVTRGQLSKVVANAAGFSESHTTQDFQDVPVGSTFYIYIERLYSRGIITGYPCGGPFEPCGPGNLPYFRPNANATRGQITKIDANAAGYSDPPVGQQFQDVPVGSTFYTYTYQLVTRGIMSGYPCSGPGEPCVPPGNLPYFRPNNNATRGQTAKIVANTFFPNCQTPDRREH